MLTAQKLDLILAMVIAYDGEKDGPCFTEAELQRDKEFEGDEFGPGMTAHACTCYPCMLKVIDVVKHYEPEGARAHANGLLKEVRALMYPSEEGGDY